MVLISNSFEYAQFCEFQSTRMLTSVLKQIVEDVPLSALNLVQGLINLVILLRC